MSVDGRAEAIAQVTAIDFLATVEQVAVPPVAIASVPLLWDATFEFILVGTATSTPMAVAGISLQRTTNSVPPRNAGSASDAFESSIDPPASTLTVRFDYDLLRTDLAPELRLGAIASCAAGQGIGAQSCAMNLQTGNLVFDQDTFDQRMGADTFALDDFFAIAVVPEPATALLLGIGLLALAGMRRA